MAQADNKKRYILYSKDDGRPDHLKPCAFFNSAAGCRNGANCKFLHSNESTTSVGKIVNNPSESSEVIGESQQKKKKEKKEKKTSSSKEVPAPSNGVPPDVLQMQEQLRQQQQRLEEQIRMYQMQAQQSQQSGNSSSGEKKRKHQSVNIAVQNKSPKTSGDYSDAALLAANVPISIPTGGIADVDDHDDNDLIFGAVNHVLSKGSRPSYNGQDGVISNEQTPSSVSHNQTSLSSPFVTSQEALAALQTSGTPHATQGKTQNNSNKKIFANAKVKLEGVGNAVSASIAGTSEKPISSTTFNIDKIDFASLNWGKLVQETQQSARFATDYDFSSNVDHAWVTARRSNPTGLPVIAIDCEMCQTTDPVDGSKDGNCLIRISAVNARNPKEVLIDSLVSPGLPISEARTHIHGITSEQMQSASWTLRHAQAALLAVCNDQTILIGHSLHNDLRALKFSHRMVIDTSYLYTLHNAPGSSPSLREISDQILGLKLGTIHDSVQDAKVSLYAAAKYLIDGIQRPIMRQSTSQAATITASNGATITLPSLFVHRIPDFCSEEHIKEMLTAYTNIIPVKINPILRPNGGSQQQGAVPVGKTTVLFPSQAHADLAFESIAGPDRPDKQHRSQKRVYLKSGGYICVRK